MRAALPSAFIALLFLGQSMAYADQLPRRQISVQGKASRLVAPDQATLSLRVEGRAKDADGAMTLAGEAAAAVVQTLQKFTDGKNIRALQTQVMQVVKGTDRSWRQDKGEPVEMLATRQIQVERLAIDKLPALMAALAKQPLARIDNVSPSVSNASAIEDEILLLAIDDAKARAQRMAKRLGVELGIPIDVNSQQNYSPAPKMMMRAMAMEADAGGGYESAGENEIRANVNISFEIEAR